MKENNHTLTMGEVEQLCRLYWDCGLSPLEEIELQYVLFKTQFDSPLIKETKRMLDVERNLDNHLLVARPRSPFYKNYSFYRVAALVVVALVFIAVILNRGMNGREPQLLAQEMNNNLLEYDEKTDNVVFEVVCVAQEQEEADVETAIQPVAPTTTAQAAISLPDEDFGDYTMIDNEYDAAEILNDVSMKLSKMIAKCCELPPSLPDLNKIEAYILEKI